MTKKKDDDEEEDAGGEVDAVAIVTAAAKAKGGKVKRAGEGSDEISISLENGDEIFVIIADDSVKLWTDLGVRDNADLRALLIKAFDGIWVGLTATEWGDVNANASFPLAGLTQEYVEAAIDELEALQAL